LKISRNFIIIFFSLKVYFIPNLNHAAGFAAAEAMLNRLGVLLLVY